MNEDFGRATDWTHLFYKAGQDFDWGSTFASDWTNSLSKWQKFASNESLQPSLVYGGTESYAREGVHVWGWQEIGKITFESS